MADILATIDEILSSKVGLDPAKNTFMQGDNFQDLENNPEAKAAFQQDIRDKQKDFNLKLTETINPVAAQTFNLLSMKKLQEILPDFKTIAEVGETGDGIERAQAFALTPIKFTANTMDFLFGDAARVYTNRQEKLDQGMTMEEIIEQEDPVDSLISVIGPGELVAGLGVKGIVKLSDDIAKKLGVPEWGPKILPFLQKKVNEAEEKPDRTKLDIDEVLSTNEPVLNRAIGGDVELSDITTEQPGYISEEKLESMFADADLKPTQGEQMPEVEMAGLFGKVPLWGVAAIDKAKMLKQIFTKNEIKNMDNVTNKVGSEADVNATIDDIVDVDITADGTAVGVPKQKKTIIDSPEDAESVFYSGLEARLMDPNTPESFDTVQKFYDFINKKGVGKAEIEDNALLDYIKVAEKNNLNINKADVLKIIRDAPLRKIDNVTYGDARYGGTSRAKYDGYQEQGALPGTYREDVMYLPAKDIPLDPDALPPGGAAHDFAEKYVIGWSRLTDRKATLPVEKTAQGIAEQVDPAMIRTLKRNQTKLKNQLKGLEASAYEKIRRAVDGDLTPTDEMNARMITETIDSRMAFLEEIDTPLANQIRQFRSKIQDDSVKLKGMEATTKGQQVIVTFADEIQSDVLQNAKRFEEKLHKALGDLLDGTPAERRSGISRAGYSDELRDVNPEVAEFYIQNKTVFRPLFKSDVEMQQFIKEFQENKKVFEDLAAAGTRPDKELVTKANEAMAVEKKMLEELQTAISEGAMKQLYPNVPFKNRSEWGEALVKRDLAKAADLLYRQKIDDAAEWYAISPAKFVKNRYNQQGGTATPIDQRNKQMKGIGTEEFYGGPDSVDPKGKHYTSVLEKALKRAAKENNSEFKIIKVDGVGDVFAVKITPEMLLPHKTHRKKGGLVYNPEIINIFEAA
jgi:hypothetical protein